MTDYQRLVDELRSFLQASDHTLTPRIKELALAYVAACNEVNDRLRRCLTFLQQGLRSEAVFLAESEPVLLDALAILDFPERRQWEEISLTYDLPSPPMLRLEAAEALNEAYSEALPVESLLRKHRLLALARAPLKSRLAVMRKISLIDASNQVWSDDIRTFEKARFEQLEEEARQAYHREDTVGLESIWGEVEKSAWFSSPPPALIKQVETALGHMTEKRARQQLKRLEVELNDAFAALDLEQAQKLRVQWDETSQKAGLPREDPLWERVAPALNWLTRERRRQADDAGFQAAVRELEGALAREASQEELDGYHRLVLSYRRELPDEVEQCYRDTVKTRRRKRFWRRVLVLSAATVGIAFIVGCLYFWIGEARQAQKAAEAAQKVMQLLQSKKVDDARRFLSGLAEADPTLAKRPELSEPQRQLAEAERRDLERAREFKRLLTELEMAPIEEAEPPALARAQTLAKDPEERASFQKLVAERKEKAWKEQQQRDQLFLPLHAESATKLRRLEELVSGAVESHETTGLVEQLQQEIPVLIKTARGASPEKREWAEDFRSRLGQAQKALERQKRDRQLAQRLTESLARQAGYRGYSAAAENYLMEFADTPRGEELRRALQERPLWEEVGEWERLIQPWLKAPFQVAPENAKGEAEKLRQFLTAHPRSSAAPVASDYLTCLDAIAQQNKADTSSAAAELREVFRPTLVSALWILKLKSGKAYYTLNDIDKVIAVARRDKQDVINPQCLNSFAQSTIGRIFNLRDIDFQATGLAPQSKLAQEVQRLLSNFAEARQTWDEVMLAIAHNIWQDTRMDPIIRAQLLEQVLKCARQSSYSLDPVLAQHQQQISDAKLDFTVPWFQPENESANKMRSKATLLLGQLPALEPLLLKKAMERQKQLEKALASSELVPYGWLARAGNRWQCRSNLKLAEEHELYVLIPRADKTPECHTIGSVRNDVATITSGSREALLEGRIVFFRKVH